MKKTILTLACVLLVSMTAGAQNADKAKAVLDKTAALIGNKGGASAHFTMTGNKAGTIAGDIAIKGNQFKATTPDGIFWYNGKTQWAYVKSTEEVNISTPNEAQQAQMNPYSFLTLYKNGYDLSMTTSKGNHEVHMKAKDAKKKIKEVYITINSTTNLPSKVRLLQNGKWTTITISQFKKANLSDATFTFNPKDYPDAEIVDLR